MNVLVIAPHPDDEVLGCGGTIMKHNQRGDSVYVCIVTSAYTPDWSGEFINNRLEEIKRSKKILNIKKICLLDYPTVKLDTIPQKELNDSISNVISAVAPDVLYIPHRGDLNKDHRIVFEASLVASRPIYEYKIKSIMSYEVPSETEWGRVIEPFVPNVYVDITDTIRCKTKSMKSYASELREYPHPRSVENIYAIARKRGSEVGVELAEAFELIREVR